MARLSWHVTAMEGYTSRFQSLALNTIFTFILLVHD